MLKYPKMVVEISGHTDNKGKPKDNLTLSQNRANAVVTYLVEAGISAEQLVAKGYGQDLPIDTNDNDKGRLNNRRVEFKILEL
jgi:outer membrane protein OmpA-like peptidoglycan-associated protein